MRLCQVGYWFITLRKQKNRASILTALLLFTSFSTAGEIEELLVTEEGGVYQIRIVMILGASADSVYKVITDHEHSYLIHPSITESEILPSPDGETVRLRNHFEYCITLFCFDIDWVGDMKELRDGYMTVDTVPELSSFESGSAVWHVRPHGEHTRVLYQANMKPDFFIPPIIGNLLMKYQLREEALTSFTKIECQAKTIEMKKEINNNPTHMASLFKVGGGCAG